MVFGVHGLAGHHAAVHVVQDYLNDNVPVLTHHLLHLGVGVPEILQIYYCVKRPFVPVGKHILFLIVTVVIV